MDALVIGRGTRVWPTAGQLDAFALHRRELRDRLGLRVRRAEAASLAELERVAGGTEADVYLLAPGWSEPAGRLREVLARVRERAAPAAVVLLDTFDPTGSPYLELVDEVDLYVKSHLLRDRSLYARAFEGGSLMTDELARRGLDLAGHQFGVPVDEGVAERIRLGWNFAVNRGYRRLVERRPRAWSDRPVDLHHRFGTGSDGWYRAYRERAAVAVEPIAARRRTTGRGYLSNAPPWRRYHRELRRSKLVFSPFGWGEVCFRDYEAVCCGCLLLKPSVAHLVTRPDIYREHETYVPLEWDFADLEEKVAYYLDRPAEAADIAHEARRTLLDYYESARFVDDLAEALRPLAAR